MKRPDETKKGLETCSTKKPCTSCPMWEECKKASSLEPLWNNALAYIQQLETANAELLTKVEQLEVENKLFMETIGLLHVTENQLETKCHQLERERDAAVEDLKYANVRGDCWHCKHANNPERDADCYKADCDCETCQRPCPCANCVDGSNWQWRGVKEE